MIALSKLDGSTMHVNEEHVERVEGGVTSAVFLTNGSYLIVRDDVATINDRIRSEKLALLTGAIGGVRPDVGVSPLSAVPSGGESAADGQL